MVQSTIYWWLRKFKNPYSDELLFPFAAEQLYGLFTEITLVENEECDLANDACSKFDAFLNISLPTNSSRRYIQTMHQEYSNSYKRQGENIFSFNRPTCNRICV